VPIDYMAEQDLGIAARDAGRPRSSNPYGVTTAAGLMWDMGWTARSRTPVHVTSVTSVAGTTLVEILLPATLGPWGCVRSELEVLPDPDAAPADHDEL
jgi:hypothetical protein